MKGVVNKMFLNNLFRTKEEKRLENIYVPVLKIQLGLNDKQAWQVFSDLLKKVKLELKNTKNPLPPQHFGDILLEKEKIDIETKNNLSTKRKQGVTDEDIRRWWNLTQLERTLSIVFENFSKALLYAHLTQKGKTPQEVEKLISKGYPKYGDADGNVKDLLSDTPLPYELKHRINMYTRSRQMNDPEVFMKELEAAKSFNHHIRREIETGNL